MPFIFWPGILELIDFQRENVERLGDGQDREFSTHRSGEPRSMLHSTRRKVGPVCGYKNSRVHSKILLCRSITADCDNRIVCNAFHLIKINEGTWCNHDFADESAAAKARPLRRA